MAEQLRTSDEVLQAIERLAEAIEDVIPEWPNYIAVERKEGWRFYARIGGTIFCSDLFSDWSEANRDLEERVSQFRAGKAHEAFKPAAPPAPEQPEPSSPWHCAICGRPVRISDDLRPYHIGGPENHDAFPLASAPGAD